MVTELSSGEAFPFQAFALIPDSLLNSTVETVGLLALAGAGTFFNLPSPRYAGFRFQDLAAENHWGWAELNVTADNDVEVVAFGYETTPGTPIAAGVPEPNSLALLALGAPCS